MTEKEEKVYMVNSLAKIKEKSGGSITDETPYSEYYNFVSGIMGYLYISTGIVNIDSNGYNGTYSFSDEFDVEIYWLTNYDADEEKATKGIFATEVKENDEVIGNSELCLRVLDFNDNLIYEHQINNVDVVSAQTWETSSGGYTVQFGIEENEGDEYDWVVGELLKDGESFDGYAEIVVKLES